MVLKAIELAMEFLIEVDFMSSSLYNGFQKRNFFSENFFGCGSSQNTR